MSKSSKTDWDRVGAMADEAIDTSDIPALSDAFFSKAVVRRPQEGVPITMHVDSDVLAWFQAQGEECEQRMNAALRIYVEAHRH